MYEIETGPEMVCLHNSFLTDIEPTLDAFDKWNNSIKKWRHCDICILGKADYAIGGTGQGSTNCILNPKLVKNLYQLTQDGKVLWIMIWRCYHRLLRTGQLPDAVGPISPRLLYQWLEGNAV